jgi:hypothetical protein
MSWECPVCGYSNKDDSIQRCACGFDSPPQFPKEYAVHKEEHIYFSKSKLLRNMIACVFFISLTSFGLITRSYSITVLILAGSGCMVLLYALYRYFMFFKQYEPAFSLNSTGIVFNKIFTNQDNVLWSRINNISTSIYRINIISRVKNIVIHITGCKPLSLPLSIYDRSGDEVERCFRLYYKASQESNRPINP